MKEDDTRTVKQLIILGNGFDLTCGLKSKFIDFFDYVNEQEEHPIKNNLFMSLFQIYGKPSQDTTWADVENVLKKSLGIIHKYFEDGGVNNQASFLMISLERKEGISHNELPVRNFQNAQFYYDAFKKEVKEFEQEFTEYLENLIQTKEYIYKSHRLALNLSLVEYKDELLFAEEYDMNAVMKKRKEMMRSGKYAGNFFSFNYTPISLDAMPQQTQNIHGSLQNKNVILGIDGHDALDDLLEFTKTYRLLSRTEEKEAIDFSEEFDCIKFMGHSLSEADYSYFQAIFDGIELYSSKTKLYFYYHIYDKSNRANIAQENYKAVAKLLKHYGKSFVTNPDHGKNLMHKLILERRLIVKELDCSLLNAPIPE
ncbi:AbiH family protein [Lactococcus lactis]|uniref:AbiH family protein n=1 Tax=Lactococcus lactis TaxID=1358 RepID=UPI00288F35FA|nr:AbiH family protein [Lactococcus lactis]MDT2903713.1 AbiH family protein [Lactococcus lactis]MDT2937600.1 AbiH family protein [Lactococcus lactis]MDT2940693.1 AbiH family protein [Lactococcus lactis]